MNRTKLTKATTATAVITNPETMNGETITMMKPGIITMMITAIIATTMAEIVVMMTTTTIAGTMTATPHTEVGEILAEAMEAIQTRGEEEEEMVLRHHLRHHQIVVPTPKMGWTRMHS